MGVANLFYRQTLFLEELRELGAQAWWRRLRRALWRESLRGPLLRVVGKEGDLTYGETPPLTAHRILSELGVGAQDHVVDLGCGLGMIPIIARLAFGARGTGLELVEPLARRASQLASRLGLDDVIFHADFRNGIPPDGTVYFAWPTTLEPATWARLQEEMLSLPAGTRAVTITEPLKNWTVTRKCEHAYSWGRCLTYYHVRQYS